MTAFLSSPSPARLRDVKKTAGGYGNRGGGPAEGAPHCPRCGSSELTPTDEAQYYNEFRCDLCRYVFPSEEGIGYEEAMRIWTPHPTKAPGNWDGVTMHWEGKMQRQASARDMVPEQTLAQIGKMNLMAISGFRWEMDANGDMLLPISSGYRVRISLDANDTYTVTREMKRGDKIFVKGTQSDVYAEDLGETCYQASSYKSNDWGGHTVGSKAAAKPRYVITHDTYGRGLSFNDLERAKKELAHSVPAGEWYIVDRETKEKVAVRRRAASDTCPTCGKSTKGSEGWSTGQCDDCYLEDHPTEDTEKESMMTHPHREAQLLEALEYATPREAVRITTELDGLRRAAGLRRETGRALDWDAVHSGVPGGPVPPGLHTASTDWMTDREPVATPNKVKQAARYEAERWLLHADPIVLRHPEELEKQATDHADVWSSRFPNSNLAHRSFVSSLTELLSTAGVEPMMHRIAAAAECPSCGGPAEVWADNSDVDSSGAGITVNFACDNPKCKAGKGPWDTPRPGSHTSRRRTAASPDLREIERWCDTMGLVMKDFPDSLIDRAAETGDTSILEEWIDNNEPLTKGMWDEEPAPYSSYDNSPIGYYD